MAQRLGATLRHHLDRQAAVEIGRVGLPFLEVDLLAGDQRRNEGVVLLLRHRAVDVIGAGAAGADLVVARLKPRHRHVDGILVHDRRDRVEERERVLVGELADRVGQRCRGEGAGRNDHVGPFGRRQAGDFAAVDLDQGMVVQRLGDSGGEPVAVDRQRAAGGHLVGVGGAHDQRAQPAHLGMQQSHRVVGGVVRAERVGADQFGQAFGAVRVGHPLGAHLVQHDAHAGIRNLPRGFRTGEAATDNVDDVSLNRSGNHARSVTAFSRRAHLLWRVSIAGKRDFAQASALNSAVDTTTPATRRALSVRQTTEQIRQRNYQRQRAGCRNGRGRYRQARGR